MSRSITRRLLVSNLLVLTAFLGLAGTALDRAFRTSGESAAREQLQAHVYTLLAAADEDQRGRMRLPEALASPALNRPDSGLYAEVTGEDGGYRWRSGSLIGRDRPLTRPTPPGETAFFLEPGQLLLTQGVSWEDDSGTVLQYVLGVSMDSRVMDREQQAFRATLWRWLGGVALLLLLVQTLLMRWGLSPLRAMSSAVEQIENGAAADIAGPVPRELKPLSDNLNSLIRQNRSRQERVRNSLADLAHSMKTPLAVLQGATAQTDDADLKRLITEQIERIDQIVRYQRQRAAVAGVSSVTRPVALAPVLRRLCAGLDKVHTQRGLHCVPEVDTQLMLRADENDLFELFGNLLENAYRHAAGRVQVAADAVPDGVTVRIEDDGPGIASDQVERLLRRGERADQHHPGEGIGLAVVDEIVNQYAGSLAIGRSTLGGARIDVILPG